MNRSAPRDCRTLGTASMIMTSLILTIACPNPSATAQVTIPNFPETNGSVNALALSGSTLYLGGSFTKINPAHGGGVPVEPGTALALPGFPEVSGTVYAVVGDGAGGWFIGGAFTSVGGTARANLAHILSDLTVSSWAPSPNGEVRALALSGSTLYVGGSFQSVGGEQRQCVAALDMATGAVSPWDPSIVGSVLALSVHGSSIFIGGVFSQVNGETRYDFAVVDAVTGAALDVPDTDGPVNATSLTGSTVYIGGAFSNLLSHRNAITIDPSTAAISSTFPHVRGSVSAVVADGSGGWYIGGAFSSVGGTPRSNLAHVLADHSVSDWNPSSNGSVTALTVHGDLVYAGGEFTSIGGQIRNHIAAINVATGLPTAWNANANGSVTALAADGTMVIAGGFFSSIGGQTRNHIASLDPLTGHATSWDPDADDLVTALKISSGVVYAGGHFSTIGGQAREKLAALDPVTGLATAWVPPSLTGWMVNCHFVCDVWDLSCPPSDPCCLEGHEECDPTPAFVKSLEVVGSIVYVGGSFIAAGGQPRGNIAAIDATSGLVTDWNPSADNVVVALAFGNGVVYAAGPFTSIGGQSRSQIAALDPGSGLATEWSPQLIGSVAVLAVDGSMVCAGGDFRSIDEPRGHAAALDAVTGLTTGWDPHANGEILSLLCSGSLVYMGGTFTNVGGQTRVSIAAVDAMTGQPTSWNPAAGPFEPSVFALSIAGTSVYAGGTFNSIGGQSRNHIAALDVISGLATPWDPDSYDVVRALAATETAVYVGGNLTNIAGQSRNKLAAIDVTTGQLLPWNPNADNLVTSLAVNGSTVYAGGYFTHVAGVSKSRLAGIHALSGQLTSWDGGADAPVLSLAMGSSILYVGGQFSFIGGEFRNRLAALELVSGNSIPWNPNPSGPQPSSATVTGIVADGSTIYVAGAFTQIGGQAREGVAAIDASTGLSTAFHTNQTCSTRGVALALSEGTLYVATIGNVTPGCPRVFACDPVTGTLKPWSPSLGPAFVSCLAAGSGTIYVGGQFSNAGGTNRTCVAAFDATTAAVTSWDAHLDPTGSVNSIAVDERKVYIGGTLSSQQPRRVNLIATTAAITAVPTTEEDVAPRIVSLGPCLPNPFGGSSEILFRTSTTGQVTLKIFDIAGRETRRLVSGRQDKGPHVVHWDGKDHHGRDAASGIYFAVLQTRETVKRIKITILR